MCSEDDSLVNNENFFLFGKKSQFALELCVKSSQPSNAVPYESLGSWGAWRLWVSNINLCQQQLETENGLEELQEVTWFLAPLIRWLITSWKPLLHETRLPWASGWGDQRPRWARLAYLAMLERAGDDVDVFRPWQLWGARHALRFAAEGGVVPDVFFQRIGDEIEFSWGDRVQPGDDATTFVAEDGVTHVSVRDVADALIQAIDWFFEHHTIKNVEWSKEYIKKWTSIKKEKSHELIYWYLDSQPNKGPLSENLLQGLRISNKNPEDVIRVTDCYLAELSPEVAMFGELSPNISQSASVVLLSEYYNACSEYIQEEKLAEFSFEDPAWTTTSPWENGYALARDILDEFDPLPESPYTNVEALLRELSITVRAVSLGDQGPRGVALAGKGIKSTILINGDHLMNQGDGSRFTQAHELCHILFDQNRARPLVHSSTPWAPISVEQRANAFAAMLLMPPSRARRPVAKNISSLSRGITVLSKKLKVSKMALRRHLANLGEINTYELDYMLEFGK